MREILRIGLTIIFILICKSVSALGPEFGGQISWSQLGGDTVLVEEHVWMTCSYAVHREATYGHWKDMTTGKVHDFSFSVSSAKPFTPLCKSTSLDCNNNFSLYVITDYVVKAKVIIPVCHFKVFVQYYGGSNDLTAAIPNYIYLETEGHKCLKGRNASPAFRDVPTTLAYTGLPTTLFNKASLIGQDSTGKQDSISYSIVSPMIDSTTKYFYNYGYSYDHATGYHPDLAGKCLYYCLFHIDNKNGELQFQAPGAAKTILAIKATSWRRDSSNMVEVGSTMRCYELEIADAETTVGLQVSGANYAHYIYLYAGLKDTIKINGVENSDTRIKTKVYLMDSLPAGAKFITKQLATGSHSIQGEVIWTPTTKDISSDPYYLSLRAEDTNCSFPGVAQQTYYIRVINKPITFKFKINNAVQCLYNNDVEATVSINDPPRITNTVLDFGDGTGVTTASGHTYKKAGLYYVKAIVTLAGDTVDTKDTLVRILQSTLPNFTVYNRKLICGYLKANMHFVNLSSKDSGTVFIWRFSDGTISTDINPVHLFSYSSKSRYGSATLIAKNGSCIDSVNYGFRLPQSKIVAVSGRVPTFKKTNSCHTYQFSSNLDANLIDSVTSITWIFGDGSDPEVNVMNPKHTFFSGNTKIYIIKRIVSDGECSLSDSISLTDTVTSLSISSPDSVCAGRKVSFGAVGDVGRVRANDIKWTLGGIDSGKGPEIAYTFLKSGKYKVALSYPDDSCIRTTSKDIFIKPWLYPMISGTASPSAGRDTFVYRLDQRTGIKHKWSCISGALISNPKADSAAIVWYDTAEYSGKVICDFDTTQCIDRAELIVFPHSTSLEETAVPGNSFKLYPNPTTGSITLECNGQDEEMHTVTITDITGKILYSAELKGTSEQMRKELSISGLLAGVYYLRLSSAKFDLTRKIVKL